MTRKTIFTLFLTTVISSGAGFASDLRDLFTSPEAKKKAGALQQTPEMVQAANNKYPADIFSPETANFHKGLHVDTLRQQREALLMQIATESNARALVKKIATDKAAAEEENERQKKALTDKLSKLSLDLKGHEANKSAAEKRVAELTLTIEGLESEKTLTLVKIAKEKADLELKIEQDRIELDNQKALETQILREKAVLEEQIKQEKLEVERQKALGVAITSEKDKLAQASLDEKTQLLKQIDAEKAKKKAIMDASKEALEAMKLRVITLTKESADYAAKRDELLNEKEVLEIKEAGLRKQLALVHGHLDGVPAAASSVSVVDPTKVTVSSAPASVSVSTSGGGAPSTPATGGKPPLTLPKSNLGGGSKK